MLPALLSKRRKELEQADVLVRETSESGQDSEYQLTEAGHALFPALEAMGFWAQA
ncbi:helix-turn-helix domain-containing protein [Rhodovulum sp. ES.010]|uniref:winged helix-turn-helix transcriptional regulator n=1 Tax=Rhodovulum sp. ES.010 TaxID=1882821 RepID=UPI0009FAAFE4|nr:winged helix-turn-helix transcriptional regulator [Rhodovulum sp. ES.010]